MCRLRWVPGLWASARPSPGCVGPGQRTALSFTVYPPVRLLVPKEEVLPESDADGSGATGATQGPELGCSGEGMCRHTAQRG